MTDGPPLAGPLLARARGIAETPQSPPVVADARPVSHQPGAVPGLAAEAAHAGSRPTVTARLARPHDPAPGVPYRPVRETPPDSGASRTAVAVPAGTAATQRPLPRDAATRPVTRPPSQVSQDSPVQQVHQVHRFSRAGGTGRPALPAMPAAGTAEPAPGSAEPARSHPTAAGSDGDPAGRPVVRVGSGGRPLVWAAPLARPAVAPRPGTGQPAGQTGGQAAEQTGEHATGQTGGHATGQTGGHATGQTGGHATEPARAPVPVVRERTPPGGIWAAGPSLSQRPARLPSAPPPAPPAARPASRPSDPPEPRRVTREHRAERETERNERTGPERAAAAAVDMDHIVITVQRRLMHQFAIDRERRGMTR
ncbi:MAG TPA: hypothetical protein VGG16_26625 [Streptosporangiaceae bacterium]